MEQIDSVEKKIAQGSHDLFSFSQLLILAYYVKSGGRIYCHDAP